MTTTLTASWLLPPDEAERLHTLRHYTSSSCLYEPVFDGFIDLAARIFTLPIAFISLVDADEVLCKTNQGLPQLLRQPRVASICALAIRLNAPLVFTDLTQRSQQSRLTAAAVLATQESGVQFYTSIPLRMPDQRPIGTLCIAGLCPRLFSAQEQQVLKQLAQLIEQTLVIRQLCLTTDWLGEEHWSRIQTTLTEDLWELAALVRYLLKRAGPLVPVPADVLEPVARRLAELHSNLAVHPGSFS
ncbi:MAG: GAF domain-containing protein [Hymenobacter sp.]|nr:MAG: GAF domain-containing protein [Hymenobacter sp.]